MSLWQRDPTSPSLLLVVCHRELVPKTPKNSSKSERKGVICEQWDVVVAHPEVQIVFPDPLVEKTNLLLPDKKVGRDKNAKL